jgi:transposase
VARDRIPQATVCLDPFHVIKWTNEVVESVYRAQAPRFPLGPGLPNRRQCAGRERLGEQHHAILAALRRRRYRLWRTWELN